MMTSSYANWISIQFNSQQLRCSRYRRHQRLYLIAIHRHRSNLELQSHHKEMYIVITASSSSSSSSSKLSLLLLLLLRLWLRNEKRNNPNPSSWTSSSLRTKNVNQFNWIQNLLIISTPTRRLPSRFFSLLLSSAAQKQTFANKLSTPSSYVVAAVVVVVVKQVKQVFTLLLRRHAVQHEKTQGIINSFFFSRYRQRHSIEEAAADSRVERVDKENLLLSSFFVLFVLHLDEQIVTLPTLMVQKSGKAKDSLYNVVAALAQ